MKVSDFTFDLPEELIAQDPLEDRSSSRLLTLDKNTGEIGHDVFHNIVNYLKPGDCLVLNNTKVIPARLIGAKEETGGKVEVLLLKRKQDNVWETLVKPGKKAAILAKCLIINVLRLILVILFFIAFLNITYTSRHTAATTVFLGNEVSIENVAKILGHSNIKMTQHYAKVLDSSIMRDMVNVENNFLMHKDINI